MDPYPAGLSHGIGQGTVRLVRAGGFALVACVILFLGHPALGLLLGARLSIGAWTPLVTQALNLVLFAIGLWGTRAYFGAAGHRRSVAPVLVFIIGMAVSMAAQALLQADGFGWLEFRARNRLVESLIGSAPLIVTYAALMAFAVQVFRFRRQGGGLWAAVGILHFLLGTIVVSQQSFTLLARLVRNSGLDVLQMAMIWIPPIAVFLIYPAVLICHAIGLFKGAKKLGAMDDVAMVFD